MTARVRGEVWLVIGPELVGWVARGCCTLLLRAGLLIQVAKRLIHLLVVVHTHYLPRSATHTTRHRALQRGKKRWRTGTLQYIWIGQWILDTNEWVSEWVIRTGDHSPSLHWPQGLKHAEVSGGRGRWAQYASSAIRPWESLQLTYRALSPFPQETEHWTHTRTHTHTKPTGYYSYIVIKENLKLKLQSQIYYNIRYNGGKKEWIQSSNKLICLYNMLFIFMLKLYRDSSVHVCG